MNDNKKENKQDEVQNVIYKFPENYPGKETKEKVDKLESIEDENEAIKKLDEITGLNDEIIQKDYLSSIIQQNKEDNLVYFEVENIYSNPNSRAYKNRFKMRKNPPILSIKDDKGQEVAFKLTENFVDELSNTLKEVKRAYYGFSGPSDIQKPQGLKNKIKYYMKKNQTKLIAGAFLVAFLIYLGFSR